MVIHLFGEITPKVLAIRNNVAFAKVECRPIDLFARLITPLREVIRQIADFFITLIDGKLGGSRWRHPLGGLRPVRRPRAVTRAEGAAPATPGFAADEQAGRQGFPQPLRQHAEAALERLPRQP